MALTTERTTFSLDVQGRYICNTWREVMDSANPAIRSDARPFDIIVLGGGTFGAAVAQHLFNQDTSHSHRILVLEAGPFVIAEHTQNLPLVGLDVAAPTSISALRAGGQDRVPQKKSGGWRGTLQYSFPASRTVSAADPSTGAAGLPSSSILRRRPRGCPRTLGRRPWSTI